jgi:hypothetical protein
MITRIFTLLVLLCSLFSVTRGQSADVHVKLSLAESKPVYRIGEPIRIVLEFTADRDGYILENGPEGNEPFSDKIAISPATGITHWYAELADNLVYGRDVFGMEKLTSSPSRLEVALNDSLRFDSPGRYTVSVTTTRVKKALKDPLSHPLIFTTNEISFEVQAMSDEDEAKEVKRLSDLLDAKRDVRSIQENGKHLSYLTGEASTREKVRRFITPELQASSGQMYNGLFIARNRALALKLVETAMRDPNIPVTSQMLSAAIRLKMLLNFGVSERPVAPPMGVLLYEDPRNREIREVYTTELAAGLRRRSGNSLTTTAQTIFIITPRDAPADSTNLREARNVLVQQFDTLHPFTQEWLLRVYWEQVRDPSLIPILKKMLTATGIGEKNVHEAALLRLLEIAPDEVRHYVIAEIRNPNSFLDVETLGKLKDESLPEVDASLLEQMRKLVHSTNNRDLMYLRPKAQLLARFATENIYRELLQLYQEMGANLPREARPGFLAYFAKHNEREAMPLIEEAVTDLQLREYPQMLTEVTALYYSDAIGALLKQLLDGDDVRLVTHAAYLIGVHGSASDQRLLEARLKRWREQWSERVADADAQQQGQIERELINALINSKSWKLPAERVRELQLSCVTQMCRQANGVRQ